MKKGTSEIGPIWLEGESEVGMLLLHGWTSPTDEFLPLARKFNSLGWTVYVPLLAGHGTKPEDLENITWHDWLRDAKNALAKIRKKSSRVFVGGISMGGNLALLLAGEEGVEGVILLGTPIKFRFHSLGKAALHLMGFAKKYHRKYYPPWVRKKMGERNVYPYYPITSAKEVVRLAKAAEEFLPRVIKPVLVVQSKTDHMVSKKSAKTIYQNVESEKKELLWLEDAYHVFLDNERVYEKMKEFILENIKP